MALSSSGAAGGEPGASGPVLDLSVAIHRPPSVVFALLADVQDSEPIPRTAAVRMVKDPAAPTRVGTRWHEWVRVVPGYWYHVESVVTHVQEPHELSMDFRSRWLSGHLDYVVEPTPEGSLLHHRERVRPHPLLAGFAPMIVRSLRRRVTERLGDIKQILESSR